MPIRSRHGAAVLPLRDRRQTNNFFSSDGQGPYGVFTGCYLCSACRQLHNISSGHLPDAIAQGLLIALLVVAILSGRFLSPALMILKQVALQFGVQLQYCSPIKLLP